VFYICNVGHQEIGCLIFVCMDRMCGFDISVCNHIRELTHTIV